MTQAEIIEKIGFGCNGDRTEALFRAGLRGECASWTRIDASAESEAEAFARTRALQSGSRNANTTSDSTMRGEVSSASAWITALRVDDARRMARASRRGR
jgi:hypothetical protein